MIWLQVWIFVNVNDNYAWDFCLLLNGGAWLGDWIQMLTIKNRWPQNQMCWPCYPADYFFLISNDWTKQNCVARQQHAPSASWPAHQVELLVVIWNWWRRTLDMHYVPSALLTLPALPNRGGWWVGGEQGRFSVEVQAGGRAWPLMLFFFFALSNPPQCNCGSAQSRGWEQGKLIAAAKSIVHTSQRLSF